MRKACNCNGACTRTCKSVILVNMKIRDMQSKPPFTPKFKLQIINEPPRGKTNNLHMRKQRRRSASR